MPKQEPERIRSFIAISIPPEIKEKLGAAQREVQRKASPNVVRWTRPEQLHVTLKFLGDVARERVSALQDALAEAVVGVAPFALSIEGFGCFPSARSPRVFWAGLGGQLNTLKDLQAHVEGRTGFAHPKEQREFHPHVTIGRAKSCGRESQRIAEALVQIRLANAGLWTVSEVALMRSDLSSDGAIHSRIAAVKLTG